VSTIAKECGWAVEVEMLRIPSTRNTAIIGRQKSMESKSREDVVSDMKDLVKRYGGACGWEENAYKLVKASVRGH
jgi:tRNASer (uridine44-2'-O)-methyltransferase